MFSGCCVIPSVERDLAESHATFHSSNTGSLTMLTSAPTGVELRFEMTEARFNFQFSIFIALPFEYLFEAEHLVAVLGGFGEVELLSGFLHELAGASDALL